MKNLNTKGMARTYIVQYILLTFACALLIVFALKTISSKLIFFGCAVIAAFCHAQLRHRMTQRLLSPLTQSLDAQAFDDVMTSLHRYAVPSWMYTCAAVCLRQYTRR